jgi:hypothetical protein
MKSSIISIAFLSFFSAMVVPGAAAAQTLTSEEVTQVMESPAVKGEYLKCVAGKPHPTAVDLDLIIGDRGAATLSYTSPTLDPQMTACFAQATRAVFFKSTGHKYEITYPMELPEVVPAPVQPPPTHVGPQPQPTPAVYTHEAYLVNYRLGLGLTVLGGLMTLGGPALMVAGLIVYAFADMEESMRDEVLYICAGAGVALLVGGIILLIFGIRRLKRAAAIKRSLAAPQVSLLPAAGGEGFVSTLRWSF